MKVLKKLYPFVLFIGIIIWGFIRMYQINSYEILIGKPTMTGSFTFMTYGIISIIVTIVSVLIYKISSINEDILNRTIKLIFIITALIISIPIIIVMLYFFH
ncbi:hypothetical protein [uncultured Clostridium sp.]|uniref:hypothetical protein n=1 Tax=uncultured Clostridium sp. TaxID=59620 RepID=UPI0025E7C8A1|nr:hypothetical protein [uncultured Clostridium sp.]